jgi:hypothetical protein
MPSFCRTGSRNRPVMTDSKQEDLTDAERILRCAIGTSRTSGRSSKNWRPAVMISKARDLYCSSSKTRGGFTPETANDCFGSLVVSRYGLTGDRTGGGTISQAQMNSPAMVRHREERW